MHHHWITGEPLRGSDIFQIDLRPDAVLVPERAEAGFGGNSRTGQDDDGIDGFTGHKGFPLVASRAPSRKNRNGT